MADRAFRHPNRGTATMYETPKRWRRCTGMAALALGIAFLAACSSGDVTAPNPSVADFVGDWNGVSLVLTSQSDPTISPDLIALGATFSLNVQKSGEYTAILLYSGGASTEIGKVEVSGQSVTLDRTYPSKSTTSGVYSTQGDHLILDGETQFDFNLDGTAEPALVHFDLVKK
jgi:hypothetical protein